MSRYCAKTLVFGGWAWNILSRFQVDAASITGREFPI
jgi:hypothetical protein